MVQSFHRSNDHRNVSSRRRSSRVFTPPFSWRRSALPRGLGGACWLAGTGGSSYTVSGQTAGAWSYRVRAVDDAGNMSPYSNAASVVVQATDTQAPAAPTSLTATAASSGQINLAWMASTDNVGAVTGYRVERCQGSSCSSFAQVGRRRAAELCRHRPLGVDDLQLSGTRRGWGE